MKRALECTLAIVILLLAASMFRPIVFLNRETYRTELRAVFHQIQPGMPRAQVQAVIDAGGHPNLQFAQDDDHRWLLSTPLEFGAQNWVLLVEFKGQQVSAVRVRTEDSFDHHPAGAPADK